MTAISQRRKLRHRQVGIRSRPQGGYVHWPFWVPYLSRQAVAPMCYALLWGAGYGPWGVWPGWVGLPAPGSNPRMCVRGTCRQAWCTRLELGQGAPRGAWPVPVDGERPPQSLLALPSIISVPRAQGTPVRFRP